MAKMIFDEYDDEDITVPVTTHRNVIAPNREKQNNASDTIVAVGKSAAAATAPIVSLIDHALTLIPDILGSIATMVVEVERTAQIKAQVHGQIEAEKQKTRQIEIKEEALTERTLIECQKEIELKKIELQKFREELVSKDKKNEIEHNEFLKSLDVIKEAIMSINKDKDRIMESIPKNISSETSLQEVFTNLNSCNEKLVEFVHDIVALRNGGKS